MQPRIEDELATVLGIVSGRNKRPSRQHIGKADDVVLAVAGTHAERMQLHDFARNVLVQAAAAVDAGNRVRPHRAEIVEIEQHRRMALDGLKQIDEVTERIGANGLALVSTRHALDLVGRDAEMVGPEPHQPLGEADVGAERGFGPQLGFLQIHGTSGIGNGFGRLLGCHLPVLLLTLRWPLRLRLLFRHDRRRSDLLLLRLLLGLLGARRSPRIGVGHGAIGFRTGGQAGGCGERKRAIELGDQRAARVGPDRRNRSRSRPHSEATKRQHSFGLCRIAHGECPLLLACPTTRRTKLRTVMLHIVAFAG
ncbi:hypothetical protein ACVWWG_000726 [Bradyrhizobium sp. LB7.2]